MACCIAKGATLLRVKGTSHVGFTLKSGHRRLTTACRLCCQERLFDYRHSGAPRCEDSLENAPLLRSLEAQSPAILPCQMLPLGNRLPKGIWVGSGRYFNVVQLEVGLKRSRCCRVQLWLSTAVGASAADLAPVGTLYQGARSWSPRSTAGPASMSVLNAGGAWNRLQCDHRRLVFDGSDRILCPVERSRPSRWPATRRINTLGFHRRFDCRL